MIWISIGRWNHSAGRFFIRKRFYRSNGQWTPLVRVTKRYASWRDIGEVE